MKDAKNKLIRIYDTMFNHFGPQGWWPGRTRLEIAVGAILTQNTAWHNVEKAIRNLRQAKALSVSSLHAMRHNTLANLIRPAGYFNVKSKRLKNFITMIAADFDGSIGRLDRLNTEALRKKLLDVNGIGKETADSILLYVFNRPVFVIDAYTRRILSRHNMIAGDEEYDDIRRFFETHLPTQTRLFNEYHALIVCIGKYFCKPKPKCEECPLCKLGGRRPPNLQVRVDRR
jgi:endonuclease-3 related protein